MQGIMTVRDAIRDFLRKFHEIIAPLCKFIFAYLIFTSINSMYGGSEFFEKKVIIFLLSVISALVPNSVVVFIGGVSITAHCFATVKEGGMVFILIFLLMYCTYMRMFPKCAWVLAVVPILYMWKLYYAIPIIVAVFAGASGMIPAAFGVVIYHYSILVKDVAKMALDGTEDDKAFAVYMHFVDGLLKNKEMLMTCVVFAVVILFTALLYLLPYDYSWYVAIVVGGVFNILAFMIVSGKLDQTVEMGQLVGGSVVGILVAALLQAIKSLVDYSRKEVVQFEDDEYYYYVRALPKFTGRKKPKKLTSEDMREAVKGYGKSIDEELDTEREFSKEEAVRRRQARQQRESAQGAPEEARRERPVSEKRFPEGARPAGAQRPTDGQRPQRPVDGTRPAGQPRPADGARPAGQPRPANAQRPADGQRPDVQQRRERPSRPVDVRQNPENRR